jgi:hypothetical protein
MKIIIGLGSCGIAAGGLKVKEEFLRLISENPGINAAMSETGCMGMCYKEVMVEIIDDDGGSTIYGEVNEDKVKQIFKSHVLGGLPVREYVVRSSREPNEQDSFLISSGGSYCRAAAISTRNPLTRRLGLTLIRAWKRR